MAPEDAAQATAAGVVAVVVGALGVHPQVLGYALTGAAVGTLAAPAVGRWRAMFLFGAVVALSALGGTWVSVRWFNGDRLHADVAASVLAMLFHPLFTAVVAGIPSLGAWLASRITGGKT